MPTTCLVSYEIHPTTKGGCGVLLHHAAEVLLERGDEVVFLLDLPRHECEQFRDHDRLDMPNADKCRVYLVDDFLTDFPLPVAEIGDFSQLKSLRFAHAIGKLTQRESLDFIEFFDYCGTGFYTLSERLYADDPCGPVVGVRIHSPMELLDMHGASSEIQRGRYQLWGLERGAISMAEAVLVPTRTFYEGHIRKPYRVPPEQAVVSQSPKRPFPRVGKRPSRDDTFRIVFFGRLFHLKGVDQFVHAATILLSHRPDLKCVIDLIGYDSQESPFGGSYSEYLKRTIPPTLRDRFVFSGHVTHEEMAAKLDDALFAVFPNRLESFCYALHEVYDAGVPVIVNDLPAFRDFFEHEQNAIVYDGTTQQLVASMERLIDDPALCERLSCPHPVAQDPLGEFYASPKPRLPVVQETLRNGAFDTLVVVLCDAGLDAAGPTLDALNAGEGPPLRVACLVAADEHADECMWWLGRSWRVCTPAGETIPIMELVTGDAIVVLSAGDRPDQEWLPLGVRALQRRPNLGFAGTWSRCGDRMEPSLLDVVPELHAFDHGPKLTRALLRTVPGTPVIDLLDQNLGNLGEIGYLWETVDRWGPGRLCPRPHIEIAPSPDEPVDTNLLQYLLASRGHIFADRLALLSGIIKGEYAAAGGADTAGLQARMDRLRWQIDEMSTSNHKLRAARDLGGRDLLGIVARKLLKRLHLVK